MKIFKSIILALTVFTTFLLSCQKELAFDSNGVSIGTFKKDAAGDCLPATVNGIFKVDSVLTNALFVDVQVNASSPGTFDIRSDTVNGYYFSRAESVVLGTNTIRLYPGGKPIAAGTNTFIVKYGTSTCTFTITVVGAGGGIAIFTLGGAPGVCSGATIAGTYTAGVPLTPANTLTIQVNVTSLGTYGIVAASTSPGGFLFTGNGVFSTLGLQNVTLTGSGTPSAAGTATFSVTNLISTCTYDITVLPAGGGSPAVYSFDGGSGICTNFIVNGTYTVGAAMTTANTVTLNVTVTTPGTYTITTNTTNNITFSKSGVFTNTGTTQVVLTATGGIPSVAGPATFAPTGTSTCNFTVTFVAAVPPPNMDYFPLTNNSWWSYDIVGKTDTAYNIIFGTNPYNSNTYIEMQDNFAGVPKDTAHYRKSSNDYYQWATQDYYSAAFVFDTKVYTDILFLKENAANGTTWTSGPFTGTTGGNPATLQYNFKIENNNTSIIINSVTYTNVIYVSAAVQLTTTGIPANSIIENDEYYYAKGIGLIKVKYTVTPLAGGGTAEADIKHYKVF